MRRKTCLIAKNKRAAKPAVYGELPEWATPEDQWPRWAKDTAPREGKYYVDEWAAERVVRFFEKYVTHVTGAGETWEAGKPLVLEEWQKNRIIRPLFGWKNLKRLRRYRKATIFIPRKNGKTLLVAGLMLYAMIADREPGSRSYCAASSLEQADECFEMIKQMIRFNKTLRKRIRIIGKKIADKVTGNFIKILSGAPRSKMGTNIHFVVVDELHEHPTSALRDALHTGTSSRRQPLTFQISTAGQSIAHFSKGEFDKALKIQDRDPNYIDDTLLGVVFHAPDGDWRDPETWKRANPNLGVSVTLEYMRAEVNEAMLDPAMQERFERLHLNRWTGGAAKWIRREIWVSNNTPLEMEALRGKPCYAGVDLSEKVDLTAVVFVFPLPDGFFAMVPHFFVPGDNLQIRCAREAVRYDLWEKQGLIHVIPGPRIDDEYVCRTILEFNATYPVMGIGIDKYNASGLVKAMGEEGHGFPIEFIPQGFLGVSETMKEFHALLLTGKIIHGNHPIFTWNVLNTEVKSNAKHDIMPVKPARGIYGQRNDGLCAAIDGLVLARKAPPPSIYETKGSLLVVRRGTGGMG